MHTEISLLQETLECIEGTWGIEIVINDFTGALLNDPAFLPLLDRFYIHKNPFCMAVKQQESGWEKCMSQKECLKRYCQTRKDAFTGICYAGHEELVIPITCNGSSFAAFAVGGFTLHHPFRLSRMRKTGMNFSIDLPSIKKNDLAIIEKLLYAPAAAVGLWYTRKSIESRIQPESELVSGTHISSSQYILAHALEYMKQNFTDPIGRQEIAAFCRCSASTLSHIVKRSTAKSIPDHLRQMRCIKAEQLLTHTELSITEIAFECGYRDSNYFSRSFSQVYGTSPSSFRRFGPSH
jgi:AraC-like DNA-binding protein